MSKSLSNSFELLRASFAVLSKQPYFEVPIILTGIISVAGIVLFRFFDFKGFSFSEALLNFFLQVTILAYLLCFACAWMLELVQQVESGKSADLLSSFREVVEKNSLKIFPIAFFLVVWWLVMSVWEFTSASREIFSRSEPSAEDGRSSSSGAPSKSVHWSRLGWKQFEKLGRLAVFMALPSICWEGKGPVESVRRGLQIVETHPVKFLSIYSLEFLGVMLLGLFGLPLLIGDIFIPEGIVPVLWALVLGYVFLVWEITIYFEQMNLALYYLWFLKWEKAGSEGELSSVEKPSLLDELNELHLLEKPEA